MIATRIMAPKGGSGFRRLAAYVVNAKGDADPASWTRLGAYVLDTNHAGEKVAWARVSGCQTTDPGWAVKEVLATQARNKRAKADKSYHLVVSFPPGEKPSREQMEQIEDRLVAALGFEEHQRISAVHQNTDNWHLHVAINRVHPKTFCAIHPFRDHYRLQEAVAELEIEFGLTRTAVSRNAAEAARNVQQKREAGQGRAAPVTQERTSVAKAASRPPPPRSTTRGAFERDLARARAAREKALRALRIRQAAYAKQLYEWHSERLRKEGLSMLRGHLRRDGFAHLAERRRHDRTERLATEADERRQVMNAHPLPQWKDYEGRRSGTEAKPVGPMPAPRRHETIKDKGQGVER